MRTVCTWLLVGLVVPPSLRADDESRAVVEKAAAAHGGKETLAKLGAVRMTTKGTVMINGAAARFSAETSRQLPDRSKVSIQLEIGDVKLLFVQVQNGKMAWSSVEGETEELKDERLAEQQARTHQFQVQSLAPLLRDKDYMLSALGEIKVNERPALGVRATRKGQADINLYFDKENGLLVKSERRGLDLSQKEVNVETYYSDYKDVDGLKQPARLLTHHDGKVYMEAEVSELRFEEAIDAGEFAKP
jgi:hypothetical protein